MANIQDISNIENLLPGVGKNNPQKRFGAPNRQPLAAYKNGFPSGSNTMHLNAKTVKDEQLKRKDTLNYQEQENFPVKNFGREKQFSNVGVTTRSQYNAQRNQHTSLGCPVPRGPPAFTIYEDEWEDDAIVVGKKEEKALTSMEVKPSCSKDVEMEEEEEEEDEEDEDDYEEEEEYDDDEAEADSSSIVDMSVTYEDERVICPKILERNMEIERELYGMSEYRNDIYVNSREAELRTMPRSDYMMKQPDITYAMRAILIDWLVEVSEEYRIKTHTFFMAVNYVDRYLSRMACSREKLQLLGTAALCIASKYEEIEPQSTREFISITDHSYTLRDLLKMERSVFQTLNYGVIVSTACFFANDLFHQIRCSDMCTSLTMYILELTLVVGEEFMRYLPSLVATTSVFMSSIIVDKQNCIDRITEVTSYKLGDLRECFDSIVRLVNRSKSHPQQSVRLKYNQLKYHSVSQIVLPDGLTIEHLLSL